MAFVVVVGGYGIGVIWAIFHVPFSLSIGITYLLLFGPWNSAKAVLFLMRSAVMPLFVSGSGVVGWVISAAST